MAGTAEVLSLIDPIPNTDLSVLIPNGKGLDEVFRILSASISPDSAAKPPPPVTEVAIFTAATDAFSRANTNVTVSDSLARLEPVARAAREKGLKVRGYVSVIITCPYSGRVDPRRVRDVSRELLQMGCYEVSLGDTTGTGTPASVRAVLEEVCKEIDPSRLAGHVSAFVLLRSCTRGLSATRFTLYLVVPRYERNGACKYIHRARCGLAFVRRFGRRTWRMSLFPWGYRQCRHGRRRVRPHWRVSLR
jgi:hypothetical protein